MTQASSTGVPGDNPRLNAILAEYLKRKDAGQQIDKQALLQAYPDLADGLRSYFEAEAMIAGVDSAMAETVLPRPQPKPTSIRETVRPGAPASDTASDFQSRTFGRYQLLRPVGEGAMGSVFLAHDASLDRHVALKIPKVEGKSAGEFLARFAREAKAAAGLKHPNICSVFDTGEQDGVPYITMEFIDGVPLSRFVGSSQLRSIDSILQMVATIAEAVEHAHSKGIIHRDLKPGNILVDADFKPYVTDFGLARRINSANESRMTQEGLIIGTPAYMAPEQVRGEQAKVGPRSDVYSLGAILFELLTSRLPFEGNVAEILSQVLRDHPPSPSKFRKDLTDDVDDLCVRMLRKDPEKRFASMKDVLTAILQLRAKLKRAPFNSADVARQQSPFDIEKSHIEQMLTKGQYAAAIKDLEKLARETLPGAKTAAEWARKKLPGVKAEAKALSPAGLTALLQTAQQLFAKHDYPGVIQLLEDVPSLRRIEAMEELLEKAHAKESEAERLLDEIKDRERNQNLEGIESLVKRFLKLKPGNSYAKRLSEALQTYSKTPATRRTYRYEKGRLQPMPEPGFLAQWAILGSLVGVLVFLSVYAYVIYLKSDKHTLAVHVDDNWLKENGGKLTLLVDGDTHTISTNPPNGEALSVDVTLGEHTFSVKSGETVVNNPESFNIDRDGRQILSITRTDIELVASVTPPPPPPPLDSQSVSVHVEKDWLDKHGGELTLVIDDDSKTTLLDTETLSLPVEVGQHDFSVKKYDTTVNGPKTLNVQKGGPHFLVISAKDINLAHSKPLDLDPPKPGKDGTEVPQPSFAGNEAGQGKELVPGMKFRWCPAGSFTMGSPASESGRENNEDQVSVTLSSGFWLGETEVTQAQWTHLMQSTPWKAKVGNLEGSDYAASCIRQGSMNGTAPESDTATEFCRRLTSRQQRAGQLPGNWEFALPTEAQWEYACRAGTTTRFSFGTEERLLDEHAWFDKNVSMTNRHLQVVGLKKPNPWGLRDMHGNVWEWCADQYADKLSGGLDPIGPSTGLNIGVYRGGSIWDASSFLRSARRKADPQISRDGGPGFRVAAIPTRRINSGKALGDIGVDQINAATRPSAQISALSLDGDDWIEISSLKYSGTNPLTLEAIVRPLVDSHQTIIGNFQKSGFGLEMLESKWSFAFHDETTYQFAKSDRPANIGETVHLAAVFDSKTTVIFVDGKQQTMTGRIRGSHRASPYSFWIGADPNADRKPEKFWNGLIYYLRVSNNVRYTKDFPRPRELSVDGSSIAVYDMSKSVNGNVLRDLSGNGWDGVIHGAKLLASDSVPIP